MEEKEKILLDAIETMRQMLNKFCDHEGVYHGANKIAEEFVKKYDKDYQELYKE